MASAGWIAAAYDEARAASLLDRTLYADHVTYLAGDLLPKTDRMTMAHSVESRAPFLDVEVAELLLGIQTEKLIVRGLRKSLTTILPLLIRRSLGQSTIRLIDASHPSATCPASK